MNDSSLEMRKCKTCGIEKPLTHEFFSRRLDRNQVFYTQCRECDRARKRKRYPDFSAAYRAANMARYYANPEVIRAQNRQYYRCNIEKSKKYHEKYRIEHYEVLRAQEKARMKRWEKEHPVERRAYTQKRRALALNATIEPVTKAQIDDLFVRQRGKCAICYKKLKKWHIDHIIPLSKGGEHCVKNFQLVHPKCNQRKSDKNPIDFMRKLGFLL